MNLNAGAVDELVKVLQPHNVMVDVAPHLHQPVEAVRPQAMGADSRATVQTADVLLVLPRALVHGAADEEL